MTFSIVARDPGTGELGAAVQRRLERLLALDERLMEVVRRRRRLAEFLGLEPFPGALY